MELTRSETITTCVSGYEAFSTLIASLSDDQWDAATRCAGWACRDVAGHVVGVIEDVAAGQPGARTADEEAAALRGESPEQLAKRLDTALDQLRPTLTLLDDDAARAAPSGVPDLTMGDGLLLLAYDVFVHGDDVLAAIGHPPETGPGLQAAVAYLEDELSRRGWGPAMVEFEGFDADFGTVELGVGGPVRRVDPLAFVHAATGRTDPAPLGFDASIDIYA